MAHAVLIVLESGDTPLILSLRQPAHIATRPRFDDNPTENAMRLTPIATALVIITSASIVLAPLAEAARIGKGRSSGMQRSTQPQAAPAKPAQPAATPQTPGYQPAPVAGAAAQPNRGMGMGTVLAAGAVGAAAGYMIGQSGNETAAAAPATAAAATDTPAAAATPATPATPAAPANSMPWGWILLLGALTLGGVMIMRRKMSPAGAGGAAMPRQSLTGQGDRKVFNLNGQVAGSSVAAMHQGRLPDGSEPAQFLRQAKASFLHLQTLHEPGQIDDLRKSFTPELFAELEADLRANLETADFPQLEIEFLGAAEEHGRFVASARFHGMVSETLHATPVPFAEIWHFVKTPGDVRWLVAGIQQQG